MEAAEIELTPERTATEPPRHTTPAKRVTRHAAPWLGMVCAVLACTALAITFVVPHLRYVPKEELVKTSLWGAAVLGAFAGWGTLVARVCWPGERVPIALRAVWGASVLTFLGGVLAALSCVTAGALTAYVVVGHLLLGHAWVKARDEVGRGLVVRLRAARHRPAIACAVFFLAAGVAIHYLGGAADTSSNPYDDDVSYYPFARQLLERGTLIDPFSFRRMSTLGGQALYHALLLVRVNTLHLNLFDRAMCFVLAIGLLTSHRVNGRRTPMLARMATVAFLVLLPNTSINSASYYSGLAFFIALFLTLEEMPTSPSADWRVTARRVAPLALTAAALCTLRQNYQATVGGFIVLSFALLILRSKRERRNAILEAVITVALLGALLVPWLALLYRSNQTFLFPLMKGTFRAGVHVRSQGMTLSKVIRLFVDVFLTPEPVRTLPLFGLVGLWAAEKNPRSPMASLWLAGFASVALAVLSFTLADAGNLSRYNYAFLTAAAVLTWQVVGARVRQGHLSFGTVAPVAILAFAMFDPHAASLERSKRMLETRLQDTDELLRRTVPMQAEPPIAATYHDIQNRVPAGSRLLVMLDEPYFLDYARNEIWNLDMPGTASPAPGIPCFQGPEPVAEYLLSLGIRHLAFVLPDRSAFLYRHEVWFDHIYDPLEIWRIYGPYITDVMANVLALSKSRERLVEKDGMVLIDLQAKR